MSSDEHRRPGEAAQKALWLLRNGYPPPLERKDFNVDRLRDKEGQELLTLTREAFRPGLAPGSKKRRRFEELLERCADRPGVIEVARKPPPSPPLPKMLTRGVTLPSYLLAWIVADPRKTELDSLRVGVLWKIVAGLENRRAVLVGSRIQDVDREPYMIVASTDRLRVDVGDGSLAQPEALRFLAAQGLLSVERNRAAHGRGTDRPRPPEEQELTARRGGCRGEDAGRARGAGTRPLPLVSRVAEHVLSQPRLRRTLPGLPPGPDRAP